MTERNEQGQIIPAMRTQEESGKSPSELHMQAQTVLLTEIRDMLRVILSSEPTPVFGDGTGADEIRRHTPKKKPGRPRKTHEYEVG